MAKKRHTAEHSISKLVNAHRASVRRWLTEKGIRPIEMGRTRIGVIQYRWSEIERWLKQRVKIDQLHAVPSLMS
jgi:uncharacterized protein YggL (DUF469 family)